MIFFAYGSCMDEVDLRRTVGDDATFLGVGVLDGYDIVFDVWAPVRKCRVSNIRATDDCFVEGVLWEVTDAAVAALDAREMHPDVYRRTEIEVLSSSGVTVRAFTYIAPSDVNENGLNYLNLMIDAARTVGLSEEHIARITENGSRP